MLNNLEFGIVLITSLLSHLSCTVFHDDTQVFFSFSWEGHSNPSSILNSLRSDHQVYYARMFGVSRQCEESQENQRSASSRELHYDPMTFSFFFSISIPFVVPIYDPYPKVSSRHGLYDFPEFHALAQESDDNTVLPTSLGEHDGHKEMPTVASPDDIVFDGVQEKTAKIEDYSEYISDDDIILDNPEDIMEVYIVDADEALDLQEGREGHEHTKKPSLSQTSQHEEVHQETPKNRSLTNRGDTRVTARTIFHGDMDVSFFLIVVFWTEESFEELFWRFLNSEESWSFRGLDFINYLDQKLGFCLVADIPFSTSIFT